MGASILSTKAKQEEHQKQEAAAVNKTLLSIDYTSVYSFNNFRIYPYSISIPENISITDYREDGDTVGFKKPKVRISN